MALLSLNLWQLFGAAIASVSSPLFPTKNPQLHKPTNNCLPPITRTNTRQLLLYSAWKITYNLLFHPLRRFPGPLLMRATRWGYNLKRMRGTLPFDMLDLHRRYGPVVRVAPDELAFADPRAWRDIMGHQRTAGQASTFSSSAGGGSVSGEEFAKWEQHYRPVPGMTIDIVSAGREEHALLRRCLAHGFSDRSMREQQPLIKKYIDLLITRLRERAKPGNKVDMAAWYNWTTFDVIGDLAFGER
jgi:cytochrome P450